MEEVSHGMHTSSSTELEKTDFPEWLNVKQARNIDPRGLPPTVRNTPPSAEAALFGTSLEGQSFVWPNITDSDMTQSYTLGKLNLEVQIVVELFQQCVIATITVAFFTDRAV